MIKHFKEYSSWIKKITLITLKFIEIGSNDGSFLRNFKSKKTNILGIEPSSNVANIAKKNGIKTINSFFSYKTSKNLKTFIKKTDIIIAANVICHIPNLKDLIRGVDNLLSTKGSLYSIELSWFYV